MIHWLRNTLFLLLAGSLLLFIAYWNLGTVPAWLTLLNTAVVAIVVVSMGALFYGGDATRVKQFYDFCSSGLFFIALGIVFLFLAQWSMGSAHAGITFRSRGPRGCGAIVWYRHPGEWANLRRIRRHRQNTRSPLPVVPAFSRSVWHTVSFSFLRRCGTRFRPKRNLCES
jgi:hypothetical protein